MGILLVFFYLLSSITFISKTKKRIQDRHKQFARKPKPPPRKKSSRQKKNGNVENMAFSEPSNRGKKDLKTKAKNSSGKTNPAVTQKANAASSSTQCGFLSKSEYMEFLDMYPFHEKLFKKIPKVKSSVELWNKDVSDILKNSFKSDGKKTYNLSEWNLWQSSKQSRFLVTKSNKSKILCDILNKTGKLVQKDGMWKIVDKEESLTDLFNSPDMTEFSSKSDTQQPKKSGKQVTCSKCESKVDVDDMPSHYNDCIKPQEQHSQSTPPLDLLDQTAVDFSDQHNLDLNYDFPEPETSQSEALGQNSSIGADMLQRILNKVPKSPMHFASTDNLTRNSATKKIPVQPFRERIMPGPSWRNGQYLEIENSPQFIEMKKQFLEMQEENEMLKKKLSSLPENLKTSDIQCSGDSQKAGTSKEKKVNSKSKSKFPCNDCGTLFSNAFNLQTHHNSVHLGIKQYACDLCDYRDSKETNMTRHRVKHFKVAKKFECSICHTKFTRSDNMIKHVKKFHKDSVVP